jgi:adenylylsulfate kinase-like enzyme
MLNDAGQICICALLSPLAEDRKIARDIVGPERFMEVYLSAPEDICRQREQEFYAKGDSGDVPMMTGVSSPYEVPDDPDIILPTHEQDPDACVQMILSRLASEGFVESV